MLNGQAIHRLNQRKVAQQLAILPQNPAAPEDLTVRDLVARGRFARQAWWRPSTTRDRDAIGWALEMTGLVDFAPRRLSTLSGGERQHVDRAALAQEPASCCRRADDLPRHSHSLR